MMCLVIHNQCSFSSLPSWEADAHLGLNPSTGLPLATYLRNRQGVHLDDAIYEYASGKPRRHLY